MLYLALNLLENKLTRSFFLLYYLIANILLCYPLRTNVLKQLSYEVSEISKKI